MEPNKRIRIGDRVTIFRRGKKKIWCADFWRDGQHRRQSLKTADKKVAMGRGTKLAATLVDGTYHRPVPAVTIAETTDSYIEYLKTEDRARKTISKYRGIFDALLNFLREHGVTCMGQVTATHFDKFRAYHKQDHAVKSLYTDSIVVKQLFRWARKRKLIIENPLEDIKLSKPKPVPKPGPTLDQINAILAGAGGLLHAQIAILAFTGMRSGDLQRLLIDDHDTPGNWMHIVSRAGAETKTRESRKVPIHPRLQAILTSLPRSMGPWLFTVQPSNKYPQGGHWLNTRDLNEDFKKVLKKLKLPVGRKGGFTIHSLRHSFETICIDAGIPTYVVDAWLGHAPDRRSMGTVYYHLSDAQSQDFMKRVLFGPSASAANAGKED
jgi:integrase